MFLVDWWYSALASLGMCVCMYVFMILTIVMFLAEYDRE
jgi:hypothetical protein